MKKIFTFIIIINIYFASLCQQNDLKGFEKFLGPEKTEALNMLELAFDNFLKVNFPNKKTMDDKTKVFLQTIRDFGEIDTNWTFNTSVNVEITNRVESSGLRKEFWTYGYEDYIPYYYHQYLIDSITKQNPDTNLRIDSNKVKELYDSDEEIMMIGNPDSIDGMSYKEWSDSLLEYNWNGKFIFGIDKLSKNDSLIIRYLDAKEAAGNISPSLIASGLLYKNSNLTEPFVKRIILMEIYYGMIKWDVKNKSTTR